MGLGHNQTSNPVEGVPRLGDHCPDLNQHMHPGFSGNAAANQFGRNLPGLVLKSDSPVENWDRINCEMGVKANRTTGKARC